MNNRIHGITTKTDETTHTISVLLTDVYCSLLLFLISSKVWIHLSLPRYINIDDPKDTKDDIETISFHYSMSSAVLRESPNPITRPFFGGARWLSGRVSDSGARGPGFETYRRRVVSLSKTLYSPKVLVNYPGSDGSVPTWLKNCWLGR